VAGQFDEPMAQLTLGKPTRPGMNLANASRKDYFKDHLLREENASMRKSFADEIEAEVDEFANQNCLERAISRLPDSSLFIFYKKSKIRQWCMKLAEPPEHLAIVRMIEKAGSYEAYLQEQEEKAEEAKELAKLGMNRE